MSVSAPENALVTIGREEEMSLAARCDFWGTRLEITKISSQRPLKNACCRELWPTLAGYGRE